MRGTNILAPHLVLSVINMNAFSGFIIIPYKNFIFLITNDKYFSMCLLAIYNFMTSLI